MFRLGCVGTAYGSITIMLVTRHYKATQQLCSIKDEVRFYGLTPGEEAHLSAMKRNVSVKPGKGKTNDPCEKNV